MSENEWLEGSLIGSGSYGTVHLAINSVTGALFVAKSAKSEAGIKSLKNEAEILEKLNSPHVITCMGKTPSSKTHTLFFEYMAGGSLSDVAQKFGGALNENLTRLYAKEILLGLKYLHDNNIVHSDIKCKNILLTSSGALKLADFGCARFIGRKKSQSLGGTPLWMAPEVLRNEKLDFAADIWSLGCTVIEMATGRAPWGVEGSDNPMGMMLRIARGDGVPEFPVGFSGEGVDFLGKCLERDPAKRWTSEMLLEHAFVRGRVGPRKDDVISPTSVLDVGSDDEFVGRIPFSEKRGGRDEWITVRSR